MKAIVFDRFGDPREVLQVRDVSVPEPGPGEVRVRMIASPINPSDLLMIRGRYGTLPKLPATPGFEGVGVVEAASPGLGWLLRGRRVAVLNAKGGNWQEHVVVPANQVVPVWGLPDEQAAMFFVNPASALIMVRRILEVPRGAWLLQTAAGSALGRMIIRLGRKYGFRTLSVVRRRALAEELIHAGSDAAVATDEESLEQRVQALTGGAGVPFALDAVGGSTGLAVIKSLGTGGRMVVYGTLSGEPIALDPRLLMVGRKRVEGFWLSEWARSQGKLSMLWLCYQVRRQLRAGVLTSDVAASLPLDQIGSAIEQAETPGRHGKVLLRMT